MIDSFSIAIRADATPSMGTGHVMRCIALAQAAKSSGLAVCLVGHITVPWVLERLHNESISFTLLAGPPPAQESPAKLLQDLASCGAQNWVVLDGYHFGPDCHKAVREAGYKLLVIDDYAHLPEYSCDVLLNQNIGAEELMYSGTIGQTLVGPRYALLREEFYAARSAALQRPVPEKATELLLTLGGGNFSHILPQLAPAFSLPELAGCTVRVIAGGMAESDICKALEQCPANIIVLPRVENMPALLLQTDLCITAGGSTCWELCCLGVPFLTVEVAENQRKICEQLEQQEIAPRFSGTSLFTALSRHFREHASTVASHLVDGAGSQTVTALLHCPQEMTIAPATPKDCLLVHALANDPSIRAVSCSTAPISLAEHTEWYTKRLGKKNSPFYLVWQKNTFIGYVRYDATETSGEAVVSIALTKECRGKGFGSLLLQETAKLAFATEITCITAWIKPDNKASQRAFLQAGYSPLGSRNYNGMPLLCFTLRPSR